MELLELQDWIRKNLFDTKNRFVIKRVTKEIEKEIINYTLFLQNKKISQRVYHILNEIWEVVLCKECNKNEVSFKNIKVGYSNFCCHSCAQKNNDTQKKYQQACLNKFGVPFALQSKEVKEKSINTNLKKHGVNYITQTKEHKEIVSQKRNNENEKQKNHRIESAKNSCLKKYNVSWFSKTDLFKDKCQETWLKTIGVTHPSKLNKCLEKSKNSKYISLQKKYPILIKECLENNLIININCPENCRIPVKCKCKKGHIFYRDINALTYNKICPLCNNNKSKAEIEIAEFLNLYNIKTVNNNKSIINPLELDIFIPDKKLAIEYDGIYWHSEINGKDRNYHLTKTNLCNEKGIQLIHIFEDEWINKKEICKSVLLSKLGKFENRIYARKCIIKEINTKDKNEFLENNHLQGKDKSSIKLGLFYNNELVSVMTFGRRKITGKSSFELIRFCSKLNTQVIGGANKLFKYFINNYWDEKEITTYADKRWSNGKLYEKLGFSLHHESSSNYWYIENGNRIHRVSFQKHKLKNKLEEFNYNLTEWENMQMNGYDRIWDCGNFVFKYK